MARPFKLSFDQAYEALKRWRSGERTSSIAKHFGVSVRTMERYYKRHQLGARPGPRPVLPGAVSEYDYACIVRYLREHPETVLPRSIKGICKLTGCSAHAVKSYFVRLRREVAELASSVNIKTLAQTLADVRGRTVPTAALSKVRVGVAPWTLDAYYVCDLRSGGHAAFKISRKRLIALVEKLRSHSQARTE